MILYVYNKAPIWWTEEEWDMSKEEREHRGIKLIKLEFND